MFPGFNRKKKGSISKGDWDRDGVKNRKDCEPLNFRKQGPKHKETGVCSFCEERKPLDELRKTVDGKELVCRYLNECKELRDI